MMTTRPDTLRVLILEDDEDDARLAALTLEAEGRAVEWRRVETGAALADALDAFAPEVVLADYNMPRLSAWQALEMVAARSQRVPLIVVSGTIGEETAVDLLWAGASNFVAKRHLERLVPAVDQALTELRLRREHEAAETALALSERRHRAFVTASSLFTWRFAAGAELVAVDDAWLDLVGMSAAQAAGDGWLAAVHPDDRPRCRAAWRTARRELAAFEQEYRLCCADGRERWILDRAVPVRDETGGLLEWIGAGRDVTERHRLEHERRKLSRALDQAADGIIITDARRVIEYVNPAFERLTGYPAAEAVGRTPRFLRSRHTDPAVIARLDAAVAAGEPFQGVMVNRRRNGEPYHADMSVAPVRDDDGVITHFIASQYDITDKLRREKELSWLANHDPVTGLANRLLVADRLAHLLHQADGSDFNVVVAQLDIDGFGLINESWGHEGGNHVLKVVGERLAALVGDETAVGRVGNDGFVVVKMLSERQIRPEHWPGHLAEAISPAIEYGGETFSVTATLGFAVGPTDADDAEALLGRAETALHRAKSDGPGSVAFYAPAMSEESRRWLAVERDLQLALEQAQFHLVYQPQVDLRSGRVVGAEALLRWTHPDRGLVSPAEFIPMLERTGLIVSVGEWVIREACAQLAEWRGAAPEAGCVGDFRVAVNLSLKQFQRRDLADVVQEALRASGADPAALELELTETSLAENPGEAARQLGRLRELGVTVAMDDFGTGYSSLSYLKRLPIDVVKIDRAFVEGVTHDPGDAAILRAVVLMAASRGMKTVAEGVETEEQLRFLVAERCHIAQGYYFAPPVEPRALAAMLDADRPFEVDRAGLARRSAVVMLEDHLGGLRAREGLQAEGIRALEADCVDEALSLLALEGDVIMVIVGPRIGGEDAVAFLDRLWRLHPRAVRVLVAPATEVDVMRRAVNDGRVHRLVHRVDGASGFRDEMRAALAARDSAVPPLEDRGARPVGITGTR